MMDTYIVLVLRTYSYTYHKMNEPSSKVAIKKVDTLSKQYILLESLLFKITPEKEAKQSSQFQKHV